eukprot:PhF_6_TR32186/c0_g1_i5/m.47795
MLIGLLTVLCTVITLTNASESSLLGPDQYCKNATTLWSPFLTLRLDSRIELNLINSVATVYDHLDDHLPTIGHWHHENITSCKDAVTVVNATIIHDTIHYYKVAAENATEAIEMLETIYEALKRIEIAKPMLKEKSVADSHVIIDNGGSDDDTDVLSYEDVLRHGIRGLYRIRDTLYPEVNNNLNAILTDESSRVDDVKCADRFREGMRALLDMRHEDSPNWYRISLLVDRVAHVCHQTE